MGQLDLTNILIDDFRKGKNEPTKRYVFILSHIHSDHLRGLNNSWNHGIIYCSQITRLLILDKFKGLKKVLVPVPLYKPQFIEIAPQLEVKMTFLDANHCQGAVMVLLEGYFGRYLYTGDFRFEKSIFQNMNELYPPLRVNPDFDGCSIHIDKMWLDNTFCDERFDFPPQKEVLHEVDKFFSQEEEGRPIIIGMDHYGKQQVLVHISKKLNTLIVVDEYRYESIKKMNFDAECFTTNPQEGYIKVVMKSRMHEQLKNKPEAAGLVMTGWNNQSHWKSNVYYVPYSLHSSYPEIVAFVKSIRPSCIQPIVKLQKEVQNGDFKVNSQRFYKLCQEYTCPMRKQFKDSLEDEQLHKKLAKKFSYVQQRSIQEESTVITSQFRGFRGQKKKGFKIAPSQEDIQKLKQEIILKRKEKRKPKQICIQDDEDKIWNLDDSSIEEIENFMKKPERKSNININENFIRKAKNLDSSQLDNQSRRRQNKNPGNIEDKDMKIQRELPQKLWRYSEIETYRQQDFVKNIIRGLIQKKRGLQ